jgi:hypothetical protein
MHRCLFLVVRRRVRGGEVESSQWGLVVSANPGHTGLGVVIRSALIWGSRDMHSRGPAITRFPEHALCPQ